jgi:hypothetical protein
MVTEVVSRVATTIESSKHQESTTGPVLDPSGAFLVLTVPPDRARSNADVLFGEWRQLEIGRILLSAHLCTKSEARIAALGAPPDDSPGAGEANS